MSVEIWLFTESGNRAKLRQYLLDSGFAKSGSIHPMAGQTYYFWFDEVDFRSRVGVSASIYQTGEPDDGERVTNIPAQTWVLHTRTRASATSYDREKQNDVIRNARRLFGGRFYNDWHGWNRYTPVEADTRTPAERGIRMLYDSWQYKIGAVSMVMPKPSLELPASNGALTAFMKEIDPATYLYNAMLPYAVAAIENFFSGAFIILIRYSSEAQKKLKGESRKIEMADALAIMGRTKTLEDIVASWYSFQNLQSIHKAYFDWLGIDFWKIVRRDQRKGRRILKLADLLESLIQTRHSVVHGFDLDFSLDYDGIMEIFQTVEDVIEAFLRALSDDFGIKVLP